MAYDKKCRRLAEEWLDGEWTASERHHSDRIHSLAQAIQTAIEDWSEENPESENPEAR